MEPLTQTFHQVLLAGSGNGFRLSAEGNGFLEVENARIRGTLSTAVFEKETVNAVGGIMMIGNSTVITGSQDFRSNNIAKFDVGR